MTIVSFSTDEELIQELDDRLHSNDTRSEWINNAIRRRLWDEKSGQEQPAEQ